MRDQELDGEELHAGDVQPWPQPRPAGVHRGSPGMDQLCACSREGPCGMWLKVRRLALPSVHQATVLTDAGPMSIRCTDARGASSARATNTLIGVTWVTTTT